MGGTWTSVPSEHSMSVIGNPSQLGLFPFRNLFSAGVFSPKTDWLPNFNLSGLTLNTTAVIAGVNLADYLDLPLPVTFGIGYTRIYLNLGSFYVSSSSGPIPVAKYDSYEKSDQVSFGAGIDYVVKFGVGVGFKFVDSRLSPVGTEQETGTGEASVSATDFGIMLEAPLIDIAAALGAGPVEIVPGVTPVFDVNLGFVRSNIGGSISYFDAAQEDPLPRKANVGSSVIAGIRLHEQGFSVDLFSFTLAREAEQVLVNRSAGSWTYITGFGDISLLKNVIGGRSSGSVGTRKGWQIELGEFVSVRQGSINIPGLQVSTSGYGVRLSGVLKGIQLLTGKETEGTWLGWLLRSVDLRYDHATYGQVTFGALNLLIRTLPI